MTASIGRTHDRKQPDHPGRPLFSCEPGAIHTCDFSSPGLSAQPLTPSRFLPSQASLTGKLGLFRNCLPIALPPGHHRPNDAGHLVRESNSDHEAGSSGQQAASQTSSS